MSTSLSVVICTHNPVPQLLNETILFLRSQTLALDKSELLIVDNSSPEYPSVGHLIDLSWHPHSRCIRETTLGLTNARLTGYSAAKYDVIVYIDDDNLLDPDYLKTVQSIANNFPQLGVWGAGSITPRFEKPPEEWTKQYWYLLALRDQEFETWSNFKSPLTTVVGAGMCVRRNVMAKYAELVATSKLRSSLDPIGKQLNRAGDQDIFYTAYDIHLGVGVFPSLKLTHVIPSFRLKEDYLLQLVEGYVYSNTLLNCIRNLESMPSTPLIKRLYQVIRPWFMSTRKKRFYQSALSALEQAKNDYSKMIRQS
jgi:glycosyltransferase involved in cell wall biosynthesis